MIEYEGRVFRPPSEAYSLIVQVTIGCSHNKCTFCDMYKEKRFRVRKLQAVSYTHLDPLAQELCRLQNRVYANEQKLKKEEEREREADK